MASLPARITAPRGSTLARASRALGLTPLKSNLEFADALARGLPGSALARLSGSLGWSRAELAEKVGIPARTAARLGGRRSLSTHHSELLARLARAFARAGEVLESEASAKRWLVERNAALGGRTPVQLLGTDVGAALVLEELDKIDHGFFA